MSAWEHEDLVSDTPMSCPCVHVIEKSAYDQALARLAEAERVLEWYADKENYNKECAPTYDQKSLTNDPDSGHDFGFEYDSGQKAREFLGREK